MGARSFQTMVPVISFIGSGTICPEPDVEIMTLTSSGCFGP
jgi:hypothetical protein